MKTLRSHIAGSWHEATSAFATLVNPSTEEPVARASSAGIDFAAALEHARGKGRAALGELTIGGRGELLSAMAKVLHQHRDELIALSLTNSGTTRKDAKFDIDGATFTLSYYGKLGQGLGERRHLVDGDGAQLGQTARYWGQHVLTPLAGCAVHINAFNFPAWGLAEKAACALLAGMPVITKPATSTAVVAERAAEIVIDAGILPDGALSIVCGSTGDLLDRLGPQDVLAFTGSADTALGLRSKPNLLRACTRFNVEADSLNAAVLAPDVDEGSETWSVFLRDVQREITQKTGQKCTAVRRIFVPAERLDAVQAALIEGLADLKVGNPEDRSVRMGPLATAQQLEDAIAGTARLAEEAKIVFGTGERVEGVGAPAGRGYFFGPTLLRLDGDRDDSIVHRLEVFAPVATLVPYDGSARAAAEGVGRGQGTLVTSVYGNDGAFLEEFLGRAASATGRLYVGSEKVAEQLPGSGMAMPQLLHGGPGRAGGGSELGGPRGLELYLQRVALTGDKPLVERLAGLR